MAKLPSQQPVPSISFANELDRNEWKIHQPGPKRDDGLDDEAAGLSRIDHVTLTEGFRGTHCTLGIGTAARWGMQWKWIPFFFFFCLLKLYFPLQF